MALALNRRRSAHRSSALPSRPSLRHPRLVGACAAVWLSAAVFVGRDGSTGWLAGRVALVASLAAVSVAALERVNERWCGIVAVVTGMAAVSVGTGFVTHLVKSGASPMSAAAVAAVVAGIALAGRAARSPGGGAV